MYVEQLEGSGKKIISQLNFFENKPWMRGMGLLGRRKADVFSAVASEAVLHVTEIWSL